MTNKKTFYSNSNQNKYWNFTRVLITLVLYYLHNVITAFYGTSLQIAGQFSRKCWSVLFVLILALNSDCFAGDTSSIVVHFAFDKYLLNINAQQQLAELIKGVPGTPTDIKIYGFTDQVGSIYYNTKLSLKRATEVSNYLAKVGAHRGMITVVQGRGETELLNDGMDNISRQQNRRVVVMMAYASKMADQPTSSKDNTNTDSTDQTGMTTEPPALIDQIKDSKVKAGDQIILRNINFEGGRHVFLPQSKSALLELLNTMKEITTLKIEIQGHICCEQGAVDGFDFDLGTQNLSVQRAKAVYNYLLQNGIEANRMSYNGLGHQYPITNEQTEQDKMINRRVEIKIVGK
jgi:outer membrane protein OmpA-like peptidoglycan-associated protein